jgi:hypothetical protein
MMIFKNPLILIPRVKLSNIKSFSLTLTLSFFLLFFIIVNMSINSNSIYVYGHSLFGNNNGSGIQIQKNGNFEVELSTFPSKPLVNKNTDIFLRISSTAGDELIELPVYLSLAKDGKVNNSSYNLTMVRSGHYNFNYVFSDKGKYLLFLNIKDIYYTGATLNFIFEINVDSPVAEQFFDLMSTFFTNYYYVFIPIILLIIIAIIKYFKKSIIIRKNR